MASPGQEGGQRLPWSHWCAAVPGPGWGGTHGTAAPCVTSVSSWAGLKRTGMGVDLLLPVLEELKVQADPAGAGPGHSRA